jgi:uncharacterized protein VirK/YbjX
VASGPATLVTGTQWRWLPAADDAPADVGRVSGARLILRVLINQLAAGGYARARRLAWRAVRSPINTARWMRTLAELLEATGVEDAPFDLARKPGQRFLQNGVGTRERTNLLAAHYDRLVDRLGCGVVGALLQGRSILLAHIEGRDEAAFRLTLSRSPSHTREGELFLALVRTGEAIPLAGLSLVVGALERDDVASLWIGGLQGRNGEDSKRAVIQATKDLWGLRPKDLLIHVAYALAAALGASDIRAVSNAGHALRRAPGERGWHADYDAFWRELGGQPLNAGVFLLPKARRRRDESEVAPAKRKTWRARYRLIDNLTAAVHRFPQACRAQVQGPVSPLEAHRYAVAVKALLRERPAAG